MSILPQDQPNCESEENAGQEKPSKDRPEMEKFQPLFSGDMIGMFTDLTEKTIKRWLHAQKDPDAIYELVDYLIYLHIVWTQGPEGYHRPEQFDIEAGDTIIRIIKHTLAVEIPNIQAKA